MSFLLAARQEARASPPSENGHYGNDSDVAQEVHHGGAGLGTLRGHFFRIIRLRLRLRLRLLGRVVVEHFNGLAVKGFRGIECHLVVGNFNSFFGHDYHRGNIHPVGTR